jgi:hypothetical protein
VSDSPLTSKREVNEIMQNTLRGSDCEPIAFFCECASERCYQAVWLTCAEYDRARADHQWAAIIPSHRLDLAPGKPPIGAGARSPAPVKQLTAGISG